MLPPLGKVLEDGVAKGLLLDSEGLLPNGSSLNGSPEAKGSVGVWADCWLKGSTEKGPAPLQPESWQRTT